MREGDTTEDKYEQGKPQKLRNDSRLLSSAAGHLNRASDYLEKLDTPERGGPASMERAQLIAEMLADACSTRSSYNKMKAGELEREQGN